MPKRRTLKKLSSVKKTITKTQRNDATKKVRKMLAAVMDQQVRQINGSGAKSADGTIAQSNTAESEEFYSTGRTGRRNALPDILGEHAHVTSSDLPARLQGLTTTCEGDKVTAMGEGEAGPSSRAPS